MDDNTGGKVSGKGHENLIPLDQRPMDEQRAIQELGWRASLAARKQKKSMKEVAEMVLGLRRAVTGKTLEQLQALGINPDEITTQTLILMKMGDKGIAGDPKAAEFLRDTAGEKPTEKHDITQTFADMPVIRIRYRNGATEEPEETDEPAGS